MTVKSIKLGATIFLERPYPAGEAPFWVAWENPVYYEYYYRANIGSQIVGLTVPNWATGN